MNMANICMFVTMTTAMCVCAKILYGKKVKEK